MFSKNNILQDIHRADMKKDNVDVNYALLAIAKMMYNATSEDEPQIETVLIEKY